MTDSFSDPFISDFYTQEEKNFQKLEHYNSIDKCTHTIFVFLIIGKFQFKQLEKRV